MGWTKEELAVKELSCRLHKAYIDEYKFSAACWDWLFSAVDGRFVTPAERDDHIKFFASQLEPQVQAIYTQWQMLCGSGELNNPVKWAERFIGKNHSHRRILQLQKRGLWGFGHVVGAYREMAGESFPQPTWKLFPFRAIPISRNEASAFDTLTKRGWETEPAVIAAQWSIIAYQGQIVATATINRTTPLVDLTE